jgi:NAD(P)H-dependent FMN reductase
MSRNSQPVLLAAVGALRQVLPFVEAEAVAARAVLAEWAANDGGPPPRMFGERLEHVTAVLSLVAEVLAAAEGSMP